MSTSNSNIRRSTRNNRSRAASMAGILPVPQVPTTLTRRQWGSCVPTSGDKNIEANFLSSEESTWEYLIETKGIFDREDMTCGSGGCVLQLQRYYRINRNQYYYERRGHVNAIRTTITKNSFWYRRKADSHKILGAAMDYIRGENMQKIFNTRTLAATTLGQIFKDIQVLMLSDYNKYVLTSDNILGSSSDCHHIQIDESKLGKRKNETGSRVEGVWIFGMVECLNYTVGQPQTYNYVDNTLGINEQRYRYKAGRRIFIAVPDRTAVTLLPLIYKYCKPGSIIRSDGWKAYNGLHSLDIQNRVVSRMSLNGFDFEQASINSNELYFRGHQVVNHSEGFATLDQNTASSRITQVPASGRIHANVIESIWRDLKSNISPRHRNKKDAPGKLLEHLWTVENKNDLIGGMFCMMREV